MIIQAEDLDVGIVTKVTQHAFFVRYWYGITQDWRYLGDTHDGNNWHPVRSPKVKRWFREKYAMARLAGEVE